MNTVYLIIVILIVILLFILLRDKDFRSGAKTTIKEQFSGSGFSRGFSNLEHFITSNSNTNEINAEHFQSSSPNICNTDSIGIVIHKFKMNNNYNVEAIDDVELKDYCSESYLEHNFINTLNNIWAPLDTKFYIKKIVTEDEIENLMKYYVSNPNEVLISDKDYCDTLVTGYDISIDADTSNTDTIYNIVSQSNDNSNVNCFYKSSLDCSIDPNKSVTEQKDDCNEINGCSWLGEDTKCISHITDKEKREYSEIDVHILKTLLSKLPDDTSDYKKVIRSIFTRMTNKTLYETDKDIHIYLVPYIEADNALIIEGRDSRPLVVISMYYKDPECNIIKHTISDVTSPHTKGLWLNKLFNNYESLIKLVDNKSTDSKAIVDELEAERKREKALMNEIKAAKEGSGITPDTIKELKNEIYINTQKMHDIYEYDYHNDQRIKQLKKYKTKNKASFNLDGTVNYNKKIESYEQLVKDVSDEIKKEQKKQLTRLENENKDIQQKIDDYESLFKEKQNKLDEIRKDILDIENNSYRNNHQNKTLNKLINTTKTEINSVKYFAEKVNPIININLLLLCLFTTISSEIEKPLKNNKTFPLDTDILDNDITAGGLKKNSSIKNAISKAKNDTSFIKFTKDNANAGILSIITNECADADADKNTVACMGDKAATIQNYVEDKINIKLANGTIMNKTDFNTKCKASQSFETMELHEANDTIQYHLITEALKEKPNHQDTKKLEALKKELENKCDPANSRTNPRIEPGYMELEDYGKDDKDDFWDTDNMIKNYDWLLKHYYKYGVKNDALLTNIKTNYNTIKSNCSLHPNFDNLNSVSDKYGDTSLNDLILKKQPCDNNYLDTFSESYM